METFWNLFDNTIIFLAMIALIFIWPIETNKKTVQYRLIMGISLSVMALFTMLNSVHVGNGLYIDARYAIPFIAIIFFGSIPGVMVLITIIIVRIMVLGGPGAPVGVTYAIIQGITIIAFKKLYYEQRDESTLRTSFTLFILAFFLQIVLTFSPLVFIPTDIAWNAIRANGLYLITIYPILVFLFSLIVGFRSDYFKTLQASKIRDTYFELTIKRAPNPMAIYDKDGVCLHVNDAWIEQSGYDRTEFTTMWEWLDLVSDSNSTNNQLRSFETIDDVITNLPISEYEVNTKNKGRRVWSIERKEAGKLPDGTNIFVSVAKDVTERTEYEKELRKISYHDFLTGLHNRRHYDDVFSNLDLTNKPIFIIYGDMNNLKSLNDYYGHTRGDDAIQACANTIKDIFNENAHIFRFGGDEFLIITEGISKPECVEKIDEVSNRLSAQDFGDITVGITFGIYELEEGATLNQAMMKAESRMYEYKIFESTSARSGTIDVILTMLFEKDSETERHSKRVQEICSIFAKELDINTSDTSLLLRAGLLHDIGKILIPTQILLSKEKLTDEQYETVKKHSYLGYRILSSKGHLKRIGEIVLSHHEHIDGNGYPNGLKGEEIPYFSRILAIVDAFEAMTTDRPYRNKKTYEEAKEELIRCSGKQFDKELVERFVKVIPSLP